MEITQEYIDLADAIGILNRLKRMVEDEDSVVLWRAAGHLYKQIAAQERAEKVLASMERFLDKKEAIN